MSADRPAPHRSRALPHPLGGPSFAVGAVANALVGCASAVAAALCASECAMVAMEASVHYLSSSGGLWPGFLRSYRLLAMVLDCHCSGL